MRNYSKPSFEIDEMAMVFICLCNAINEPCEQDHSKISNFFSLSDLINKLSFKYNSPVKATGEEAIIGEALQSLIDTIISKGIITRPDLENIVHYKISQLPPSFLVDRITGEKKFDW